MKVLLIEDSPVLRDSLVRGLTRLGLVVEQAHDGPSGLWAATEMQPDVIALDVMLPGFDGLELLRRLRAQQVRTPVLMLSALAEIEDKLQGFEAGADDYLPKPFDLRELAARLRVLAARQAADPGVAPLEVGDLLIDRVRQEVRRQGQVLPMRRRERLLLELLASQRGCVVRRTTIEAKLYPDAKELQSNSVEAAVSQLRRWIDEPGQASRIVTLRGEGYMLER
ncbi:response regulator transcription factor [Ideonella sp. DXS29W]|uniref:Response regulator transcription factor n=1 Tax=Ideonella lacteola TaxID=2984193 RepID=A0ABU9BJC2_9BURK